MRSSGVDGSAPTGHLVATAAFGLFGYGMFEVEKRQYVSRPNADS